MSARSGKSDGPGPVSRLLSIWWPVILWMALIFFFSAQSSLGDMSMPPYLAALRKTGHIAEYAVLALLLGRALATSWQAQGHRPSRALLQRAWWLGVTVASLYAVTDEFHQTFVPKRGGHVGDVLIDVLSATAALGIWYLVRVRKLQTADSTTQIGGGEGQRNRISEESL
jgi:VanZ family protein